jgi:hypothetical protein
LQIPGHFTGHIISIGTGNCFLFTGIINDFNGRGFPESEQVLSALIVNKKLLWGVQGGGFLEKSPLAAGGKKNFNLGKKILHVRLMRLE